jgi:HEPN domain-containing protein
MPKSPREAAADLAVLAGMDLKAAEALASLSDDLRPVVLFHCQQAAEKWLKAFLISSGVEPPLIHALGP